MSHTRNSSRHGGARSNPAASLAARLRNLAVSVGIWVERRRARRRLGHLSDHLLRDIGISRGDVLRESEKPFWRK
jgi:uncharacterized protein YjiS (DUF1127 family)